MILSGPLLSQQVGPPAGRQQLQCAFTNGWNDAGRTLRLDQNR